MEWIWFDFGINHLGIWLVQNSYPQDMQNVIESRKWRSWSASKDVVCFELEMKRLESVEKIMGLQKH